MLIIANPVASEYIQSRGAGQTKPNSQKAKYDFIKSSNASAYLIAVRLHPNPAYRGLAIPKGNAPYPLQDSFFVRGIGVGTRHRGAAAVTQITTNGSHTAAMRLLFAGNAITVIALWLGHEQIATTQRYLHADMTTNDRHSTAPDPWASSLAPTNPATPARRPWDSSGSTARNLSPVPAFGDFRPD